MQTLCLTGWQQEKEALRTIAPDGLHFDYDAYDDLKKMLAALPPEPDLAIGWSLGGQLLVRAIAGGYIHPKKLVLLGAPFQGTADEHFSHTLSAEDFREVKNHYVQNRRAMLTGFQTLIAAGDSNPTQAARQLSRNISLWNNGLFWLEELESSTCRGLDYTRFPETLILHGCNDRVIHPENAATFHGQIPYSKLFLLPDYGHALHLHPLDILKKEIAC